VRLGHAGTGALFGLGAAGLLAPRLGARDALVAFCVGACLGALAALRLRSWPALAHPWAAALCAMAGLGMLSVPEPAFFVLVPLVAAALAWPFGRAPAGTDHVPAWVTPALFVGATSSFFFQSASRHWQFASGSKDLGLFVQQVWLIAHGYVPFNTVMGMHMLADHMDWIEWLVAPLFRLGRGPEVLLLVQSLVVASAVFPLVALGKRFVGAHAGVAVAVAYLLAPDIHMGVLFDYNPSTLGAALLLWAAWAMALHGPLAAFAAVLLACAAKENFTLYVAMLGVTLPLLRLSSWRRGIAIAVLALAIFVVQIQVLFPMFSESGCPAGRRSREAALADSPPPGYGLRGADRACVAAAPAAQLGRALPVDASNAVVGVLLRDAGSGHGLPEPRRRVATPETARDERRTSARVRRGLCAPRRRVPALPDAERKRAQRPLLVAAAQR
jgi:hypothetical protein